MEAKKNGDKTKKAEEIKMNLDFFTSFLFVFNLLFFGPVDIYLTNIRDITIESKYVVIPAAAVSVVCFLCLFLLLFKLKNKVHDTAVNIVMGLTLALYVQGNYLRIPFSTLDGSKISLNIGSCAVNLLIWAVCIAVPFIIYKFAQDMHTKIMNFITLMICVMEITAMGVTAYNIALSDDTAILSDLLMNNSPAAYHSQSDMFEFSSEHNIIVLLTDEYDSFCFDTAAQAEPDCVASLKDFTYYKDTVGMYGSSVEAINHIFSGKMVDEPEYRTDLFDALRADGRTIDIYATEGDVFPKNISAAYADNYQSYSITAADVASFGKCLYTLVGYKYSPELIKPVFYLSNAELSRLLGVSNAYYPDNLSFYNSIPAKGTLSEGKRFKFYYLFGLHDPRNITSDLRRAPDWSVSGDEQAIAVNKILSAFVEQLKATGAYDNSDIIILADHGIKSHDGGMYPLLIVKRAGETHDSMNISDIKVSYADMYPTLLYLAGKDTEDKNIFELTEADNESRYFDGGKQYISGNIK